jgi:hypothetical protein
MLASACRTLSGALWEDFLLGGAPGNTNVSRRERGSVHGTQSRRRCFQIDGVTCDPVARSK